MVETLGHTKYSISTKHPETSLEILKEIYVEGSIINFFTSFSTKTPVLTYGARQLMNCQDHFLLMFV